MIITNVLLVIVIAVMLINLILNAMQFEDIKDQLFNIEIKQLEIEIQIEKLKQ